MLAVVLKARMHHRIEGLLPSRWARQFVSIELLGLIRRVLLDIIAMSEKLWHGNHPFLSIGQIASADRFAFKPSIGCEMLVLFEVEEVRGPSRGLVQVRDDQRQALLFDMVDNEIVQLLLGQREAADDRDGRYLAFVG